MTTILDKFQYFAESNHEGEAVVFASAKSKRVAVTWKDLYEKAQDLAKSLINIGVKRKEIVAVSIRPSPEWLYFAFGTMYAGAIPVNLAFTYKDGHDVIALMKKLERCSLIAMDPGLDGENWKIFKEMIYELSEDGKVKSKVCPSVRYFIGHEFQDINICCRTIKDLTTKLYPDIDLPVISEDDIAFLFQTSGSTGIPKLVAHTHATLAGMAGKAEHIKPGIFYSDRPFGWLGGFPLQLFHGSTRVTTSDVFECQEEKDHFICKVVKEEGCNVVNLFSPAIQSLMLHYESTRCGFWPVEMIVTGGQPVTKENALCVGKLCKSFGAYYGSTETGSISGEIITDPEHYHEHSCGKPNPTEVKIVNDDGESVPCETFGEILVQTKSLFKEYFNDPEKTKKAFTEDGWFRTGDRGKLRRDGSLVVVGRKADEILVGGMTVFPEVLEAALKSRSLIDSVVIVPVPHKVLHQEICACVVLKKGVHASEGDLRSYCESIHADKQHEFTVLPAYYIIMESFPQESNGKLSRRKLKRLAEDIVKRR